jgi:PAS domain S-box-containing protein
VEQITGYTEEEYRAIGDWGATVHPDDRERDDRDFHKLLNNEKVVSEIRTFRKDGSIRWMKIYAHPIWDEKAHKVVGISGAVQDITEQKRAEEERESLIGELKTALENVKTLGGLVPICAHCKKIRDDKGYWNQLEKYLGEHTDAKLTHGLCPDCSKIYFPELAAKAGP